MKHSLHSFLVYLCVCILGGYVLPPINAQDSSGEESPIQPKQQLTTPTIIQQPLDRIVPEGTILWLTVDVEHSSSVTYQWQKGRTNLDGFGTTSSLYLGRATPDLNGEYRVLIGYDGGELVSRVARVIVQPEDGSKTNISFYPLLTEKGAKTSYEVPSGFDGDTVVSTEENVSVDGDPVLAYTDTRGTNLKIGSFIIPREDYLVSSTYDYGRTDGGMNYYGFKVVASTKNSDPFLSEFFDKDQIFSITPVHGFPAKRETIDRELRSEPYFFYPEVVELGKIYEKTNSVTEEGVQYDNEVQFPNDNIDFTHMDSTSERTETMRVVYLLDSIKDASPSSKDIYADLLDDETMTALVVVTEHNETYRKDNSVMYFEDGSTFPMGQVYQNGLVQSTSVEWRVKGIGLVRVVSLQGLYLDEILEQRFFDVELNNNMIIGGTFDQWLYRRFGQFDIDVPETTRIVGNTEPPFIGLNKLDTDVEVHDGLVSIFGFDEVVLEPDQAPVLSGGEDLLVTEPTEVEWQFNASDPDGRQEIEYRVWRTAGLDARIDRVTGEFTLNIGSNIPDGEYTVTVRAKEVGPYSLATFKSFTVNVQMGNTGELVPWSIHNPGFETPESISAPFDNRIPSEAGEWKGFLVDISDEPSGIDFPEGNRALRLFAEPPQAEEGTRYYGSEVFQIIDFRSKRDVIDTGTVVLDFEVLANQIVAPGSEIPAELYVDLMGYSGQPSDLIRGNFSENSTVRWNINLTPDTDSSTWESMAAELPLPPETDCLAIRLGSSVEITEIQSLDQLGQYFFDNVQISMKTLEESFAQLTSPIQNIQWATGPSHVWHVDASSDTSNGPCLKPTSIMHGDSAVVQAEIQGPGTFSFEWQYRARAFSRVALMVHMDGNLIARQDEPDDWLPQSINIPEGQHTLQWTISVPGSDFPFWQSDLAAIRSIQFARNTDFPSVAIIEDIVAQAGQTVSFVADVTGSDVLSYQWYKDGVAIPGAIGTSLALLDVKELDAGHYSIRVESEGQVIESNRASLTVLTSEPQTPEPPVITTHPSDLSVFQSEDVMFSVSAQSAEQETYQWYFNDAELTGETTSSLKLLDVTLDQAGEYHVKVSNSGGSALSRSALLTVVPTTVDPPVITPQNGMVLIHNEGPVGIGKDHSNLIPVTIEAFHIDIYEVTKELWDTVRDWGLSNGYEDLAEGLAGWEGNERHPVTKVNLFDAMKWCNARSEMNGLQPAYFLDAAKTDAYRIGNHSLVYLNLQSGYRLPSEQEWEKAARGDRYADAEKTKGYKYPWGNDSILESLANFNNSRDTTAAVGNFPPNDYGLYDMSGNVWEWCVNITSTGSTIERNYRGGAFTEIAEQCTVVSTPHGDNAPARTNAGGTIGFRTVLPGSQTLPDTPVLSSIVRSIDGNQITLVLNPAEDVLVVTIEETLPPMFSATNISGSGVWDARNEKIKWGPYFDNQSRTLTYTLTPPAGFSGSVVLNGLASLDGMDWTTEGDDTLAFDGHTAAPAGERMISQNPDAVEVSLSVQPANDTVAYAVEEFLPSGFSATSLSDGGSLDTVNNKIKWGPFFDNDSRTLTYALIAPEGFSGTVVFSGFASFDGLDVSIAGDRSIEIDKSAQTGPIIVAQPIGGKVVLGESFALSVSASGSVQDYQWTKDGQPVAGATLPFLVLPAVSISDFGAYQVIVSGPDGTVVSEVATLAELIDMPAGPVIDPKSISFLEIGNTLNMTLSISSEPSKTYQIMIRDSLSGDAWVPVGPQQIASKESLTFLLDVTGKNAAFFIATEVE
ncbi:MAG: SUMF1/EgtB/PvdO family nonheme iron enzyme [Verrucomicrobiota bacterium]